MLEKKEKIAAILDFTGKECFEMRLEIRTKINELSIGQIIKVITDNPDADKTFSKWVVVNEQELYLSDKKDGKYIFYIRKLVNLP